MTIIWVIVGIVVYFLFNKTGLKNSCNPKAVVKTIDDLKAEE